MLRPIKREIDKTIVDEVDRAAADPKSALGIVKRSGISDDGINPVAAEGFARQQELGIEVLAFRIVVDDGDPTEDRLAASPYRSRRARAA
jgi:hypothetical protein